MLREKQARRRERERDLESARSNPELGGGEQLPVTLHPQPRLRAPHSARPSARHDDGAAALRPRTSLGTTISPGTFLTGTELEHVDQAPASGAAAPAEDPVQATPPPEMVHAREIAPPHTSMGISGHIGGQSAEEAEAIQCWQRAERAPLRATVDPALVDPTLRESKDRWHHMGAALAATEQRLQEQMQDYTRMDTASRRRVAAQQRETEIHELTFAHYSRQGLPYITKHRDIRQAEQLDRLSQQTDGQREHMLGLMARVGRSRVAGEERLRRTITEAICEDNKVRQTVLEGGKSEGRIAMAPAAAAAIKVSEPCPIQWPAPSITWVRDAFTGDWYRPDKPYNRGDGTTLNPRDQAPAYMTQDRDHVRTVVNRIKLPGRHPSQTDPAAGRRSTELKKYGSNNMVKMGGGFAYRSNVEPDPLRPTPSRPSYSHGLFLFPFSNEDATAMMLDLSTHQPSVDNLSQGDGGARHSLGASFFQKKHGRPSSSGSHGVSQRTESPQLRLSIKTQTRQDVADTPTGQKACSYRRAQAARGATRGGRGRPGSRSLELSVEGRP